MTVLQDVGCSYEIGETHTSYFIKSPWPKIKTKV